MVCNAYAEVLELKVHLNHWKAYDNRLLGSPARDSDVIDLVGVLSLPCKSVPHYSEAMGLWTML